MKQLYGSFSFNRLLGVTAVFGVLVVGLFVLLSQSPQTAVAAPAQMGLPVISFSSTAFSVDEGSNANILVSIDTQPDATLTATVEFLTQNGTGIAGTDYTATTGVITFTSSSNLTSGFTVQTFQNNSLDDKTVVLTLRNPTNATTGTSSAILNIRNTDATPTPAPSGTSSAIFADALEPNNSFSEASETAAGASSLCSLTFYPPGDQDYFSFWGRAGVSYTVQTNNLDAGVDTVLVVYNSSQQQIAQNDDVTTGNFRSQASFTAGSDGFFYARVYDKAPGSPVNRRYCFQVTSFVSPTETPPAALPEGADSCEFNSTAETSCPIAVGETLDLSFVPTFGSPRDTDYFRLWVQAGNVYTCDTEIPAGSLADTNMIFKNNENGDFSPQLGNDDKEPGNLGSRLSFASYYKGWLYIIVGPVNEPPLEEAALHTYTLTCLQEIATPTPTPTDTPVFVPISTSPPSGFSSPTPLPTIEATTIIVATPTPIDISSLLPTQEVPPIVNVQPLPTSTPLAPSAQAISVDVTVYYDSNGDFQPQLNEGIMDMAVALYDNATGELISFGHTNEAGAIRFQVESVSTVRVVVPYLNYTQIITESQEEVLIRVAPGSLPVQIP